MPLAQAYFDLVEGLATESGDPNSNFMAELVVLSFLAFMVLYGAAHFFSALFVPYYSRLTYGQQADWCTRVTSTAHALLTAQAGYRVVVLGHGGLHDSPYHGYATFVKVYSCLSIGYFLSDFVVIVRHFWTLATPGQNVLFILHHLCGAVGYSILVYSSTSLYFGMFRLMSELSTPFVSIHCLLTGGDAGPSKSRGRDVLYAVNGTALVCVFFAVRVVAIPFYWHTALSFWQQWRSPVWQKVVLVLFSLIGDSLNAFWFWGILKGALSQVPAARQLFGLEPARSGSVPTEVMPSRGDGRRCTAALTCPTAIAKGRACGCGGTQACTCVANFGPGHRAAKKVK